MNRIDKKFYELKQKKEKALVGFVTAGDPTIAESLNIINAMCQAGVDILELGIPFSDPTADWTCDSAIIFKSIGNRRKSQKSY